MSTFYNKVDFANDFDKINRKFLEDYGHVAYSDRLLNETPKKLYHLVKQYNMGEDKPLNYIALAMYVDNVKKEIVFSCRAVNDTRNYLSNGKVNLSGAVGNIENNILNIPDTFAMSDLNALKNYIIKKVTDIFGNEKYDVVIIDDDTGDADGAMMYFEN